MNILDSRFYSLSFILFMLFQSSVSAAGNSISLVGNQGYDLVTYQKKSGPVRGNGNQVVYYQGVAYIFASTENKKFLQQILKNIYLPMEDIVLMGYLSAIK
ncbi:hypothetical protein [Legionella longbeachae]|uniref:hypothetical protein n=1 Tax=Legionella longbeachae TaxID=450 RepID=UPI0001BEC02F|nr:hypothetical protein [Legionella longbeachae]EEZ94025.1 conserved hypothetical protein [Legionella longbeachae D-4968]